MHKIYNPQDNYYQFFSSTKQKFGVRKRQVSLTHPKHNVIIDNHEYVIFSEFSVSQISEYFDKTKFKVLMFYSTMLL